MCAATTRRGSGVRQRVDATVSYFKELQQGNIDTSLGLRLHLWRASALLYSRHPAFGWGAAVCRRR
ncbi:hypothetical protein LMG28727_07276 [Paraburkholderia kirstenboschensis]|nr:hypothetical protein LMG28727_07276 [Paraburkholderia kirstenboschensis]